MIEFLFYEMKVAVLIVLFYICYRLLLAKDNRHELNRLLLLGTTFLAFILPLCSVTLHRTEYVTSVPSVGVGAAVASGVGNDFSETNPLLSWWKLAFVIVFYIGIALSLLMMILSIARVCWLIHRCEKHPQDDGVVIAVSDQDIAPFSWMHFVVLSREDYLQQNLAILMHERGHIRHRHSLDVLFVDLCVSLQWFNPAVWLLRKALCAIHEYEADSAVLSRGVDAKKYQYLLVRKAMQLNGYAVASGFNHSTLKLRIAMMQNQEVHPFGWVKALYIVPVICGSLVATAHTVIDYQYGSSADRIGMMVDSDRQTFKSKSKSMVVSIDNAGKKNSGYEEINSTNQHRMEVKELADVRSHADVQPVSEQEKVSEYRDDQIFDRVDVMPVYPGGGTELMNYLRRTVRYPVVALEHGVSGNIVVRFVIGKDGKVNGSCVVHSSLQYGDNIDAKSVEVARKALEAEAIRVVASMDKWKPAENDGSPVAMRYDIPIHFRLI